MTATCELNKDDNNRHVNVDEEILQANKEY